MSSHSGARIRALLFSGALACALALGLWRIHFEGEETGSFQVGWRMSVRLISHSDELWSTLLVFGSVGLLLFGLWALWSAWKLMRS